MKTNNTIITKVFIKVFGDGEKYEESKGEKKGIVLAISQQKKSATGVAHGNTHTVQMKDVKLIVEEGVMEQRVEELQVHSRMM
jgi:hypothetical protein